MTLFFKCGGLSVLDLLLGCSRRSSTVEERIESAGVLAQITSPWITDNHKIKELDHYVPSLISALTGKLHLYNLSMYLSYLKCFIRILITKDEFINLEVS